MVSLGGAGKLDAAAAEKSVECAFLLHHHAGQRAMKMAITTPSSSLVTSTIICVESKHATICDNQ